MEFAEQLSIGDRVMLTETGEQAHQNHHQTENAAISGVVGQVAGKDLGDAVAGFAGQSSYPNAGQTGVIEERPAAGGVRTGSTTQSAGRTVQVAFT